MNKCMIFDLDGTLVDSRADLTTGVNVMREEYQLPPLSIETVTSYVGNGARNLVIRSLQGDESIDVDEALGFFKAGYAANMLKKTHLYPGVKSGLEELCARGWKMAVISNKPTEPTKEILRHLKVLKNFSHVIGGSSNFPLKPDPASLMFVLSETMSLGKDSWMVGDNYTDLESGRRAGMKTCFVKYGFGDPRSEPFDLEVESFAELVTEFKTSDK